MRHFWRIVLSIAFLFTAPFVAIADTSINQVFSEIESQYKLPPLVLTKIANAESGGQPTARNASTDAVGLFQWLPKSWLYASKALYGSSLTLENRTDPVTSAKITAFSLAQTRDRNGKLINQAEIDMSLGLYMGHFLGPAGSAKFINAYIEDPNAKAATLFPLEAKYNSSVFAQRTLAEVLNERANKLKVSGVPIKIPGNFSDTGGISLAKGFGDVSMTDFYPASFVPTGYDPSRSYQSNYGPSPQAQQVHQSLASGIVPSATTSNNALLAKSTPSASLIIAQPDRIARNGTFLISWVSVGMRQGSCVITQNSVPFEAENYGSRVFPSGFTKNAGTITLVLDCYDMAGINSRKSAEVTVL